MGVPGTDLRGWRWLQGRARRREYWLWIGLLFLIGLHMALNPGPFPQILSSALLFVTLVRRLHDLGASALWLLGLLLAMIATAGGASVVVGQAAADNLASLVLLLALLVLGCLPGQKQANRYGAPPAPWPRRSPRLPTRS